MSQPRLLVPTEVVRGLVDDFLASYNGRHGRYCPDFVTVYAPRIRAMLDALPEVVPGACDFHAAMRVVCSREAVCCKMTAFCGRHTYWLRARLNATKCPEAEPFLLPPSIWSLVTANDRNRHRAQLDDAFRQAGRNAAASVDQRLRNGLLTIGRQHLVLSDRVWWKPWTWRRKWVEPVPTPKEAAYINYMERTLPSLVDGMVADMARDRGLHVQDEKGTS